MNLKLKMVLLALAIGISSMSQADDKYFGVAVTVPFSLDAVGTQVSYRYRNLDLRAGVDTREVFQVGAGALVGPNTNLSAGGGIAYSSYHNAVVPYGVTTYNYRQGEVGAVTYNGDTPTTYGFVGTRIKWGEDHDTGPVSSSTRDTNEGGEEIY